MNDMPTTTESKTPEQSMKAQGIIFAAVGAASGIFAATRLASVLPLWAALLITFVIWIVLVASTTASCGSELLDILVGSVTIIVVMMVVVPASVRMWQHKQQKKLPAAQSYIETPRTAPPPRRLHLTAAGGFRLQPCVRSVTFFRAPPAFPGGGR